MRRVWNYLRTSLWFLPSLIVFAAVASALILLEVDTRYHDTDLGDKWPRLFGAGAEGAREMLSVIASSVIGVAGVAFSITVVVLALASSQFSPRVLRNFMRDWRNQGVLGGFLGIYAYCLIVLRTVRHDAFVPSMAILGSIILAFVGIGLLIFFIHHIASAIHTTSIARAVYVETIESLEANFPDEFDKKREQEFQEELKNKTTTQGWRAVKSQSTGYIQTVNFKKLGKIAEKQNTVVKMEKGVGDFIVEDCNLIQIKDKPTEDIQAKIRSAYEIGNLRTLDQDVAYGIRQLVDVALKGLSPGINDTTTTMICIDYLGAILTKMATRQIDLSLKLKGDGDLRIIALGNTFEHFVCESFDQIRQVGGSNPAVLLRLLDSLEAILSRATDEERERVLRNQVRLIQEVAIANVPPRDRNNIEEALLKLSKVSSERATM